MDGSREWRRIDVDIPAEAEILETNGAAFLSRVVNANPDGICFTAPEDLKSGQKVLLVLDLAAMGKMTACVKVSWAGFFEQYRQYRAGGKFESMTESDQEKFIRFYYLRSISSPDRTASGSA